MTPNDPSKSSKFKLDVKVKFFGYRHLVFFDMSGMDKIKLVNRACTDLALDFDHQVQNFPTS